MIATQTFYLCISVYRDSELGSMRSASVAHTIPQHDYIINENELHYNELHYNELQPRYLVTEIFCAKKV
jgi:hypothetical protein